MDHKYIFKRVNRLIGGKHIHHIIHISGPPGSGSNLKNITKTKLS